MDSDKMHYLEYILNTQVTWIKVADTKASILLAVIAAFFALCDYLKLFNSSIYTNSCCFLTFIRISIFLIVLGTLAFIITIMPSLKLAKANDNSFLYFVSIHIMKNFQFKLKKALSKNFDLSDDILNQIKINAGIADRKMKALKFGTWLISIGFIIFAILVVIKALM